MGIGDRFNLYHLDELTYISIHHINIVALMYWTFK